MKKFILLLEIIILHSHCLQDCFKQQVFLLIPVFPGLYYSIFFRFWK